MKNSIMRFFHRHIQEHLHKNAFRFAISIIHCLGFHWFSYHTLMGVSGWMFLLVPAYPGCPGQTAVKWLLLLLLSWGLLFSMHSVIKVKLVVCIDLRRLSPLSWPKIIMDRPPSHRAASRTSLSAAVGVEGDGAVRYRLAAAVWLLAMLLAQRPLSRM